MTTVNISGGGGGGGWHTTTTTNGRMYMGGGYTFTSPTIVTSPPFAPIAPLPDNPFEDLFPAVKRVGKLTQAQTDLLLREHHFIPMEGSSFCLFCFALDMYRDATDHIFVISEE
jgi:hypothetical protein